ncbi:MAG: hypothetical protein E6G40_05960, partial [Actinobacteria bacterium]
MSPLESASVALRATSSLGWAMRCLLSSSIGFGWNAIASPGLGQPGRPGDAGPRARADPSDIMASIWRKGEGMSEHRPWFASYPDGVPPSLAPYPEKSLYSILEDAARRHPSAPAIAFWLPGAPMGKTLTYRELLKQVEQFSGVLLSLGVRRGDRVGLVLPNCPQYVIAYYAALRIGAVVVGNNPLYTERELSHQLKDAGTEVCVTLDLLYPKVAQVQDEVGLR